MVIKFIVIPIKLKPFVVGFKKTSEVSKTSEVWLQILKKLRGFWFPRAGVNAIKLSIGVQTFRFGSVLF
jgi:hypothetical protein